MIDSAMPALDAFVEATDASVRDAQVVPSDGSVPTECAEECPVDPYAPDTCDGDSIAHCLSACQDLIEGTEGECRACLLEESSWASRIIQVGLCEESDECAWDRCEYRECVFCEEDSDARDACIESTATEISCSYTARVRDCADVCDLPDGGAG
jgi:hypothetical protein